MSPSNKRDWDEPIRHSIFCMPSEAMIPFDEFNSMESSLGTNSLNNSSLRDWRSLYFGGITWIFDVLLKKKKSRIANPTYGIKYEILRQYNEFQVWLVQLLHAIIGLRVQWHTPILLLCCFPSVIIIYLQYIPQN